MNAGETKDLHAAMKRRIRKGVLGLASLALAFYFGFIALLVYRSH
ncbi:MAG TPA: hypothetical protein VGO37_09600 [Steroidobacteraceae bacterium]|jgi:hypothetical protein|nr:hypothetical protein [Steroidobacteraceae bacterium]